MFLHYRWLNTVAAKSFQMIKVNKSFNSKQCLNSSGIISQRIDVDGAVHTLNALSYAMNMMLCFYQT